MVFENQSDDIPQRLRLKWYVVVAIHWTEDVYPHPLLCSRVGPITEFPDHMHEGEVVEPTALDARSVTAGSRPSTSTRQRRRRSEWRPRSWRGAGPAGTPIRTSCKTCTSATQEPRTHALDGHGRRVRRAAAPASGAWSSHSTWHHFFDINLVGDNAVTRPAFNDPREAIWRKGFT